MLRPLRAGFPAASSGTNVTTKPPLVGDRYAFSDAPAAMRRLQSGETVGKVVIEVP